MPGPKPEVPLQYFAIRTEREFRLAAGADVSFHVPRFSTSVADLNEDFQFVPTFMRHTPVMFMVGQ